MNVRLYRDSDLEPVARLFTDSVHALAAEQYNAEQRDAWAPQPPDLNEWRRRLARLQTIVAEEDARLAGFLSYERNGRIDLLFTAPAFARCGVASALYRRAEAALVDSGVNEACTEASLTARPFFERREFRVVEEQTVSRRGVLFRRFAMRKAPLST